MNTRAVLFTGVNQVELSEVSLPEPHDDEVIVETAFSAVSPGTELRCLAGRQPEALPWPFIPGYQSSGRVIRAGRSSSLAEGSLVYCPGTQRVETVGRMWGGHCGHAVVKASDLALLPNNADPAAASAARLVAIAYHGVRLSKPSAHDTVLVFGLGPIGMLSAWLHALSGARVVGMDFSEDRCTRARTGGVETIHIAPGDPEPFWREVLPQGADVVVDTTGVPSVLTAAVRAAREVPWHAEDKPRPRILIQGSYPKDGLPTLPYYDVFAREASLLVPRDCESRDITSALTFIARKALPIERLHNAVHPVSEAPSAYRSLTSPLTAPPLAIFRW